jgi:hypothetical protein
VKRAVTRAVQETAHYLGNTPAVCRASYIHPRVIDLFAGGVTVYEDIQALGEDAVFGQLAYQGPIEDAVLNLLRNPEASRAARRRQRMLEAAGRRDKNKGARSKPDAAPAKRTTKQVAADARRPRATSGTPRSRAKVA